MTKLISFGYGRNILTTYTLTQVSPGNGRSRVVSFFNGAGYVFRLGRLHIRGFSILVVTRKWALKSYNRTGQFKPYPRVLITTSANAYLQ